MITPRFNKSLWKRRRGGGRRNRWNLTGKFAKSHHSGDNTALWNLTWELHCKLLNSSAVTSMTLHRAVSRAQGGLPFMKDLRLNTDLLHLTHWVPFILYVTVWMLKLIVPPVDVFLIYSSIDHMVTIRWENSLAKHWNLWLIHYFRNKSLACF